MKTRYVLLVLLAGLAGCKSGGADPQPVAKPAEQPVVKAVPAMPIIPPKAAPAAQPAEAKADSREARLDALTKEEADAMNAYYEAIQKAMGDNKNPSQEDWQKIQETVKEPDTKVYLARAQQLLDEDKTDLTAFKTIQWMMNNARDQDSTKTAVALLAKYHMDRPEMGDMCQMLSQNNRDLLEQLATSSPHVDVRGRACYAQAEGLKNDIQTAGYLVGKSDEELAGMKGWLGDEKLAALQKLDVDATQKEIEQILERVVKDFGDVVVNKGSKRETTLGKQAGASLYEIQHLVVGQPTPEIEGVDLDKVAFKLSDYRGKVVLLDFWGNW